MARRYHILRFRPPASYGGGGGGGGGGSLHQGNYADLDLEAYPEGYEILYSYNDHQIWNGADAGTVTHFSSGGWNGGAFYRCFPPTIDDRGSGLSVYGLDKAGTFAIRRLNVGFTYKKGPNYASLAEGSKWMIVNTARTLGGGTVDRPMLFMGLTDGADSPTDRRADTMTCCAAQGTTQWWQWSHAYSDTPDYYYYNGDSPIYWADSAATFNGHNVLAPSEYVYVEYRMEAVSSAEFPNGLLAIRIYESDGTIYETKFPWNLDAAATVDASYFNEVQMFVCGYFNTAPPGGPDANMYVEGHYSTRLRANFQGWMGPQEGFLP